ncbi:hypothetical protein ACFE04_011903 [Oxalis oulophora]
MKNKSSIIIMIFTIAFALILGLEAETKRNSFTNRFLLSNSGTNNDDDTNYSSGKYGHNNGTSPDSHRTFPGDCKPSSSYTANKPNGNIGGDDDANENSGIYGHGDGSTAESHRSYNTDDHKAPAAKCVSPSTVKPTADEDDDNRSVGHYGHGGGSTDLSHQYYPNDNPTPKHP